MVLVEPGEYPIRGSGMALVPYVWYPIEGSFCMFIVLVIYDYFGTWEGYFVVFSLGPLGEFIICTWKGYLVG